MTPKTFTAKIIATIMVLVAIVSFARQKPIYASEL
jgi:hypothetical protein